MCMMGHHCTRQHSRVTSLWCRYLREQGVDKEARGEEGYTPLSVSAACGHRAVVQSVPSDPVVYIYIILLILLILNTPWEHCRILHTSSPSPSSTFISYSSSPPYSVHSTVYCLLRSAA